MKAARTAADLSAALTGPRALVLPGAYDPLSAKLVEEAGFPVVYVGSYATAAAGYGLADVGALTLDEIVRHAKSVADAVSVPVIADAEGGFFEPGNIWRTVDAFERAGVAAIHIEDHAGGKHTTLPQSLIPLEAMTQKLRAAMDARRSRDLAIIARTDAIWATKDLDEAIRRLKVFEEIGVDYLFPTGATPEMLRRIRTHVRTKIITISLTAVPDPAAWDGAADLVIDYGFCLRAKTKALKESLHLAKTRDPKAFGPHYLESEAAFEARLGYADFTRRAEKYQ
jgi:2-methylisocitrate lyase-like PEP mutase family enzyme